MSKATDGHDLTRVGPGTVMGEMMRQYWIPAALSSELKVDGDPMRLMLLGEALIAFRDSSGRVGVLDHQCPHRCASLFLGRNEENGIRCVYHGWKFDVEGRCLEMPNHVMSGVNPQGVQVTGFKVPSAEELDHDYLWRYARKLPARGDIGIFNRSHYEEVLVVRVHPENLDRQKLPPKAKGKSVWDRRYREINDWERYLTDNGFTIVKLFLNLSKEAQRIRFLKRIDLPEKNWKFSAADVRERAHWDEYQRAFSQMLSATSTPWSPWYVIPADHKWFARICVSAILAHTLIQLDPRYPTVSAARREDLQTVRAELGAGAPKGSAPDPYSAAARRRRHKRA